jgi:chromosome segregation protein
LDDLTWLRNAWPGVAHAEAKLAELRSNIGDAENEKSLEEAGLAALEGEDAPDASSGLLAKQARDLDALVALGRSIGLHDGHCPLCASNISHDDFESGLATAVAYAKQLDERTVALASHERALQTTREALAAAEEKLERQQGC